MFERLLVISCAVFAACDCGRPAVVGSAGEVGLVIREGDETVIRREATLDFGAVVVGESWPLIVTARNVGSGAVQLETLEVRGPAKVTQASTPSAPEPFSFDFKPRSVRATEEAHFEVWFAPKSAERHESTVVLHSDNGGDVTVTLVGQGISVSCELPQVVDFGSVPLGDSFTVDVPLTNESQVTASAFAGDITGADSAAFTYGAQSPRGDVSIEAKSSKSVRLRFQPVEDRSYRAQIALQGAGPCPTANVLLKGEGTKDAVSWTPRQLDFGYVPQSVTKTLEVTFTNPLSTPVDVRDLVIGTGGFGMTGGWFRAQPGAADPRRFTLAPRGVTTLKVTCTPTELGLRTATVDFKTNATSAPAGAISVACRGGGPSIRATPTAISFGRVPGVAGVISTRTVRLANVGNVPQPADGRANLFLGTDGQAPYVDFIPDPGTSASEVRFRLVGYDTQRGLEAVAGRNEVTLEVVLAPLSAGMKSGTVVVFSNDVVKSELRIPLSATAVDAAPCVARVEPGRLDFGVVPAGVIERTVRITNLGTAATDVCFVRELGLAAGTHPVFTLVNAPPREKELLAGETLDVVVRLTGPFLPLQALTPVTGALTFELSDPMMQQRRVELSAALGPQCLVLSPQSLDFGDVKLGCQSPARTAQLFNACSTPLLVKRVAVTNGGGPATCPGTAPCPAFLISQSPMIPTGGLQVTQGSAGVPVQVRYRPDDLGADQGLITIDVEQNGVPTQVVLPLEGVGVGDGRQSDVFHQAGQSKADVLFVIDDSCSMASKVAQLAANFTSFSQYATTANVDFQFAVTSTTPVAAACSTTMCTPIASLAPAGEFYRDPMRMIPPVMPGSNAAAFATAVSALGTSGSAVESGLATAVLALTPPLSTTLNQGFVRADASLAVVVVSDAGDQSPLPVSYYLGRLFSVKGARRPSAFSLSYLGALGASTATCPYDPSDDPSRYLAAVAATGGISGEICTPNWSTTLEAIGRTALGRRTEFFLAETPDLSSGRTLEVSIDGQLAPSTAYTYDPASNAITFPEATAPGIGQRVTVNYERACL